MSGILDVLVLEVAFYTLGGGFDDLHMRFGFFWQFSRNRRGLQIFNCLSNKAPYCSGS